MTSREKSIREGDAMSIFGIPYYSTKIEIPIASDEFIKNLKRATYPKQPWFKNLYGKYRFIGEISETSFSLRPTSKGTNTYSPVINGNFLPSKFGTKIELIFSIHPIAALIMFAFFIFVEYLSITKEGHFNFILVPVYLVFHLLMYAIGFMPEVRKTIEFVKNELMLKSDVA